MTTLRVLIAPDSFKGTLTATQAAEAIAAGVRDALPDAQLDIRPLADGGEGSLDALIRAGFAAQDVSACGPLGEPVRSRIAYRDGVAVLELAGTCGLLLLPDGRLEPMRSSTRGLGEVVASALDLGCDEIVVCMGGSASTDGGAGLIAALGARLLDASGQVVQPCGATLTSIASIDLSTLDPRLAGASIAIATDVANPLLGELGSARVFAPQKGATPDQVVALEVGLAHWASLLAETTGADASSVPGCGAAGGAPLPLVSLAGASVISAFEFIADAIGLTQAVDHADVVITGEGSFDEQSLMGKGAGTLAKSAVERGRVTLVISGRTGITLPGAATIALADVDAEHAQSQPSSVLKRATSQLLRDQATSIERLARPKK